MGNTISYRQDFGLIVVGAVLFTAAFLWKDLITDIEDLYFPKYKGIWSRIIFVMMVTVILAILATHLRNFFRLTNNRQQVQFDDDKADNMSSQLDETTLGVNGLDGLDGGTTE